MIFEASHFIFPKGLSAGGYFAVQIHVAFSNTISGSAVFAGGPYYCALANVDIALSACMKDPSLIDTDALVEAARVYASSGMIDSLDGLVGDQVYVYSGTKDSVVHPNVVHKTSEFFKLLKVCNERSFSFFLLIHEKKANVSEEFSIESEHCQPTTDFGNDCTALKDVRNTRLWFLVYLKRRSALH